MQRPTHRIALAALATFFAVSVQAQIALSDVVEVVGRVTNSSRPVDKAVIIALNLSDFYTTETMSAVDGAFRLPPLRSGVYRIIAAKSGFAPAVATVLPNRRAHSVQFRLEADKDLTRDQRDQIWALRSSLPKDVLHKLDGILGPATADPAPQRFQAEIASLAGVSDDLSAQTLAATNIGLRSPVGGGWVLDFRGSIHRLEENSQASTPISIAESSGVVMELRSEPGQQYRIASTRSTWRPEIDDSLGGSADFAAHNFEWQIDGAKVRVRYLAQENLFHGHENSERLEVIGDKTLMQSNRSRLGVSVSIGQENYVAGANAMVPFRTANVAANGEISTARWLVIHYGVDARVSETAMEWSPETAAEWKISPRTSLIASGAYKLYGQDGPLSTLPSIVLWNDPQLEAPRYRYSLAYVTGGKEQRFSATASVAEVDSLQRVLFDDNIDQLTEALYLEPGDVRRDLVVTYSRNLGRWFAVNVAGTLGHAQGQDGESKEFMVADLQSLYRPTRTSLDVSYRQIDQPDYVPEGVAVTRERVNLTMGQALPLPVDVRLLIGIEMALQQAEAEEAYQRRYVGGLSFAF